jgi:ATP-dependent DNA helicase DinG
MLPAIDSLCDLIALVPAPPGAVICDATGDCRRVSREEARALFQSGRALVVHGAFVAGRLKSAVITPLFDVLELFAFVRPGQPAVPSALGLARLTGLLAPLLDTLEPRGLALGAAAAGSANSAARLAHRRAGSLARLAAMGRRSAGGRAGLASRSRPTKPPRG